MALVRLGANSPLHDVAGSQKAARRRASGLGLQAEFMACCERYKRTGEAFMVETNPKTSGTPHNLHYVEAAPADYIGSVTIATGHKSGGPKVPWPCALELKGITGDVSYKHTRKQMHQIDFLLDADAASWFAAVICIEQRERVGFIIHGRDHLKTLKAGRRVTVAERFKGELIPLRQGGVLAFRETPLQKRSRRPVWDWVVPVRKFLEGE